MSALAAPGTSSGWLRGQGTVEYRRRPYVYAVAATAMTSTCCSTSRWISLPSPARSSDRAENHGSHAAARNAATPAYPSGHSTYSAAASEVLGCLFPEHKNAFRKLADASAPPVSTAASTGAAIAPGPAGWQGGRRSW